MTDKPTLRPSEERTAFADATEHEALDARDQKTATTLAAGLARESRGEERQRNDSNECRTLNKAGQIQSCESKVNLGTTLAGRYRVVEFLGEGGMGEVYRARDLMLDVDVAVKLLNEELAADPVRVEYFRNEVKLARRVTHPNICRLHDIVQDEGLWFITMQHVVGESLSARLKREGRLSIEATMDVLRYVGRGLAAAHAVGVLHRDLKPANVLIEESTGRAIIADFGIATEINDLDNTPLDIAGTRGYMAPEHAAGKAIDERTDIYALGVLAHRMVTGELPAQTPTVVASTDLGREPTPLPVAVGEGLAQFIHRCLALDPEDRPGSAEEALALIDLSLDTVDLAPEPVPGAARRWPLVIAMLLALSGLVVAGVYMFYSAEEEPQEQRLGTRFVVTDFEVSGLKADEQWLGKALRQRLINELIDAWMLSSMSAEDRAGPAQPADLSIGGSLRRSAEGELVLLLQGETAETGATIHAETLQELVEQAARDLVTKAIPAEERAPSTAELESVGATSAEAWRLWRRAQRASLMQQWSRARQLANQASLLDPNFPLAYFEESWSHGAGDEIRVAPLEKALETVEGHPRIAPLWTLVAGFERARLAHDKQTEEAKIAEMMTLDLGPRLLHYLQARTVMADYFGGKTESAVAQLEFLAEKYPRQPGLSKLLANYYLHLESESSGRIALQHAEKALQRAEDDVAVRADYGRALLRVGDLEGAKRQARFADAADAQDKLQALAGGERTNSLFDLHMSLGQIDEAQRDARRMLSGTPIDRGHGEIMMAYIDSYRGNEGSAIERMKSAMHVFREIGITEFVPNERYLRARSYFEADDFEKVAPTLAESPEFPLGASAKILLLRSRARLEAEPEARAALLAEARQVLDASSLESASRTLQSMQLSSDEGDYAKIVETAARLRGNSGKIAWLYYAASAYEELGEDVEAERLFLLLAEHYNRWTEARASAKAWLRVAEIRERAKNRSGAAEAYQAYLNRFEHAPRTDPSIRMAKRRLRSLR